MILKRLVLGVAVVLVVALVLLLQNNAPQNGAQPLTEQDLKTHLGKLANLSPDSLSAVKIDQLPDFHTVVQPYRSEQFTGYEIVLSGFNETTCNQVMKSPWVEDLAAAKSLSTNCADPKAQIHLLMQWR